MFTNRSSKEVQLSLVWIGPPGLGIGETVRRLEPKIAPEHRGRLVDDDEQQAWLDYAPPLSIDGFRFRLHLRDWYGPISAARRVLRTADGIVFVAAAMRELRTTNGDAVAELARAARACERKWEDLPLVLQVNGREMPDAHTVAAMQQSLDLAELAVE